MAQYELHLLDYWLIIKKNKYAILLTVVLVVALTLLLAQFFRQIPVYEASARVKFDQASTIASRLLDSLSYRSAYELVAQPEVIRSFQVIERAAKELGMLPADATQEMRRSPAYLKTIYALQQEIETERDVMTNIITITARADDPKLAERRANTVAEAYRAENILSQNRMVSESRLFVEEQLAVLERKVTEVEDNLLEYKERERQVFLSDEAKAALSMFTKLEVEQNKLRRLQDEAIKKMAALQEAGAEDGTPGERIFTEDPGALLSVLNSRLLDLQQERANLLINYTPQHPQVKELGQKISHVQEEMVRELKAKIKDLTSREAALEEQIAQYRDQYFSFPKAVIALARLEREVKVSSDLYASLKVTHQELLIKGSEQIEEVMIIQPAVTPSKAVNAPDHQLNVLVGSLMGVFLGILVAFMRESFDTSIATIEGVEEFIKVPVLGVIPRFEDKELQEAAAKELPPDVAPETLNLLSKLICLFNPKSILSEGYRSLRTNIQFASMDQNVKSMLMTSVGLGEGKTTTVVNLAITMAQDGKRVLLVDADLRRPTLHAHLGLAREPGLTEVLMGVTPWQEAVRTVTDLMMGTLGVDRVLSIPGLDNLHVLTSGAVPSNPAHYLNLPSVPDLIRELQEEYDMVLLDTPPILPVADAVLLSSSVGGVILVYQVGRIARDALKRAKFLLDHAQAKVIGMVLTNVRAEITPEYGYYRYGYK
ncbi:polysaccharide biosynthesis tyrosine autokinase [Nitrospiraceae bacterium AH_259_D15_M11_P09]|nr:polysaccharide biosynthesis tyrosine autokinase [Nitrospiraceae bacterium AH_259_D15_M11_P09]